MTGNLNWLSLFSGASQGAASSNKLLVNVDAGFSRGSGVSTLADAGEAFAHALWHASQAFTEALGSGQAGKAQGSGKSVQAFEEVWLHLSFLVQDDGKVVEGNSSDASTSSSTSSSTPDTSGDDGAASTGATGPGASGSSDAAPGSTGSASSTTTASASEVAMEQAAQASSSSAAGTADSGGTNATTAGVPASSSTATTDGTTATSGATAPATSSQESATGSSSSAQPVASISGSGGSSKANFLMGINIAGGEFGQVGGAYGSNYIYPSHAEIDYYASKGLDVIRVPFKWERLQTSLNGPLDAAELARIDDVVQYASSKGLKVVLDAHNYGAGFGSLIGSGATSNAAFADFWGKVASHYKSNDNVILGLMNEPNQQSASTWLDSANAAIAAIRDTGAKNEILVPGSYWDGAWTWTSSDNAKVIGGGIKDPANNFAFEVHQYMDSDGSGTHADVVSATAGVDRLKSITEWAKATGNRLFLGEFGVASDSTSMQALDGMLAYMKQNSDVWQGGTYWAGGAWWGDYMYSAEPQGSTDKAQLLALQKYA
ncbi:MAG: glycoside hydrolase family 5 protein [Alsobacter sp.]